jgi:protease-4
MKRAFKTVLTSIFVVLVLATIGMFWFDQITYYLFYHEPDTTAESSLHCPKESNVALIRIYGPIVRYVEFRDDMMVQSPSVQVVETIEKLERMKRIRAIVVEIDSPGGDPVAAEEVMTALGRSQKPTVALITSWGCSAAYMIATGADTIIASALSEVGSIGVTGSYLDYSGQNEKEGIIYQSISSGKYKDTGDPDKPLTEEERELLMSYILEAHDIFVKIVAANRDMPVEKVAEIADGSVMLGEDAFDAGLIDQTGGIGEVRDWLAEKIGTQPVFCTFGPEKFLHPEAL